MHSASSVNAKSRGRYMNPSRECEAKDPWTDKRTSKKRQAETTKATIWPRQEFINNTSEAVRLWHVMTDTNGKATLNTQETFNPVNMRSS